MPTFDASKASRTIDIKDPNAVLDYHWEWEDWLTPINDSIATYSVTVNGVTKNSDSRTGSKVTAWLSAGTMGIEGSATCRVTTAGGRTDDRTIYFRLRNL